MEEQTEYHLAIVNDLGNGRFVHCDRTYTSRKAAQRDAKRLMKLTNLSVYVEVVGGACLDIFTPSVQP